MVSKSKGIVFFFSLIKLVGHSFIQIPKCCVFFSREAGKKKHTLFFSNFLTFCVFFFFAPVKVHMSFIHSIWDLCFFFFRSPEKKKHSIFIHSFDFVQKCVKYELYQVKKKIRYLWWSGSLLEMSKDWSPIVHSFHLCGKINRQTDNQTFEFWLCRQAGGGGLIIYARGADIV